MFLSRCQNLETRVQHHAPGVQGQRRRLLLHAGLGGQSPGRHYAGRGPASYGNMTYAGLKSMIFAGVDADDPRVKAAWEWVHKFYTVKENPGMGQNGVSTISRCSPRRCRRSRR